ncbi:MAG: 3-demethylubiquinone-9 3-O-methyltransferase [Deltaproteobacteria bacterium]|nr:3-demethylubiquinone-9 3-O-methyltransferase [Deltaproteobacteria bacterium]
MVQNDLTIYSEYAHEWWTPGAPRFRSLQNLTPFRLGLIREFVGELSGKSVLDLGCGGGLIAVPLLDQGAHVVGIDQSAGSIEAACVAAKGKGEFRVGDVCSLDFPDNSFDCVLLADVLDHIPQFAKALREAARVLRPGGSLFVGTINRTFIAWFLTLFLGESLGFIPKGTHAYSLFIRPDELIETAQLYGLKCKKVQGEWPRFAATLARGAITLAKSESLAVAYSAVFEKLGDAK